MAILCFESGGTKLLAAVVTGEGNLLELRKQLRRPGQTAGETLELLIRLGSELTHEGLPLEAVSFGFGGVVDRLQMRPLTCYHEPGWEELEARSILQDHFEVPVFIENDCKLAALGEAHFGAGSSQESLFYATLGTGIGGALVVAGKILELGPTGEIEVGHLIVDSQGPLCPCGNRGCLETLCSGPGLELLSERLVGSRQEAQTLMRRFRDSEPQARQVVLTAAGYLGSAFASVVTLLNPALIVLGGGVMLENAPFLECIADETRKRAFPPFRDRPRFQLSRLGEQVVCQGAAIYARQRLAS